MRHVRYSYRLCYRIPRQIFTFIEFIQDVNDSKSKERGMANFPHQKLRYAKARKPKPWQQNQVTEGATCPHLQFVERRANSQYQLALGIAVDDDPSRIEFLQ